MIKIADLPAVRAQLAQGAAAAEEQPAPGAQAAPVEYARAPASGGAAVNTGRPAAIQGVPR